MEIIIVSIVFGSITFIVHTAISKGTKLSEKKLDLKLLKEQNKLNLINNKENNNSLLLQGEINNNSLKTDNEKNIEDIITERYAKGEINEEEYSKIMDTILSNKK